MPFGGITSATICRCMPRIIVEADSIDWSCRSRSITARYERPAGPPHPGSFRTIGAAPMGIATSNERPTSGPRNCGRRDADDGHRDAVDRKRLANDVACSAEVPLPEAVTDHGDSAIG